MTGATLVTTPVTRRSVAHRGQTPKTALASQRACGSTGFRRQAGLGGRGRSSVGRRARIRRADRAMANEDSVPVRRWHRCRRPNAHQFRSRRTRLVATRRRACPPRPFPSDDRGFIDSSARCHGTQPAFAIGRTNGLARRDLRRTDRTVRIPGRPIERRGGFADEAPKPIRRRGFLARKAGVLYAVSPTELKVTAGST